MLVMTIVTLMVSILSQCMTGIKVISGIFNQNAFLNLPSENAKIIKPQYFYTNKKESKAAIETLMCTEDNYKCLFKNCPFCIVSSTIAYTNKNQ